MSNDPAQSGPPVNLDEAYARLRRIAQKLMSEERVGHTLSATDVVHEALGKLLVEEHQRRLMDQTTLRSFSTHRAR